MALTFRAAALAAALAGSTLLAAPASAVSLVPSAGAGVPVSATDFSRYDPAASVADWRCRWRCGWGRHRGWRRNRIDAGDVLVGAAILGGVAAILSSNNRRERDRDVVIVERDPYLRDRNWEQRGEWERRDDRRSGPRGTGASGLDNAVDQCLDRIERDVRVDSVDDVRRTAAGWQVSGALFDGSPFQCRIGNDGRIETIDFGGGFAGAASPDDGVVATPRADGQWSDERYGEARLAARGPVPLDGLARDLAAPEREPVPAGAASGPMPAYPGGPIPGETIPENIPESVDRDF